MIGWVLSGWFVGPTYADAPVVFAGRVESRYEMRVEPGVEAECRLTRTADFPRMAVERYSFTVAVPPDHDGQRLLAFETNPPAEELDEDRDDAPEVDATQVGGSDAGSLTDGEARRFGVADRRRLVQVRGRSDRPTVPTNLKIDVEFSVALSSRKLSRRRSRSIRSAASLSAAERSRWVSDDAVFDHRTPAFLDWKRSVGLTASPNQTELEYGRAVFDRVVGEFLPIDRFAPSVRLSDLCRVDRTDAAGLSILFVGTLRSEGLPARTLVGHHAESLPDSLQETEEPSASRHVIAEFHATGVGWIPVDLFAAARSPRGPERDKHFGSQVRPFVTTHFGHDLTFDTDVWGTKTENFFQFPRLWFRGRGEFRDRKIADRWTVTTRRAADAPGPAEVAGRAAAADRRRRPVHVPVPHVRQARSLCAPASASMVLAAFGVRVPQEKIKALANSVAPKNQFSGTYFRDLVGGLKRAGIADWGRRQFGTDHEGFLDGVRQIHRSLLAGHPVLVDTDVPPIGHTVVVNGVDFQRQLVLVVDPNLPAPGVRRLSFDEFERLWRSSIAEVRGAILTSDPTGRSSGQRR